MRIDFVSDVACPWCAIGLHSLERALEQLDVAASVEFHFQPFELNPGLEPEGRDLVEYLGRKYGKSPAQVADTQAMLRERGAAVGFTFGARERIWNTFDAHRLLHWAGEQGAGRQRALKHALLGAYHTDGRNPGAPDVLLDCAIKAGLDTDAARAVIASDHYADEVRAQERRFRDMGIDSVPSIIVDGRHLIQGGQPPDVFVRALSQLLG